MEENHLLTNLYYLHEHPFDPDFDPKQQDFDFRAKNLSLLDELQIFNFKELEAHFFLVGDIKGSIDEIQSFFLRNRFRKGRIPAFSILLEAPKGTGRTSILNYLANRIKVFEENVGFQTVKIPSNNFGKFLSLIQNEIRMHFIEKGKIEIIDEIKIIESAIEKPNELDEFFLEQILSHYEKIVKNNKIPPLILVIEPLDLDRQKWMVKLFKILKPLNVFPVFVTENKNVALLFNNKIKSAEINKGLHISLGSFNHEDTKNFLKNKLDYFRNTNFPNEIDDLFPFCSDDIPSIIGDKIHVKLLIEMFNEALNIKLEKLANSSQKDLEHNLNKLLVSKDDFQIGYSQSLQKNISEN
jgi:Cdc6-like AAA superfamily ATPase